MSIIKHATLQKIVAHDFRYDPRTFYTFMLLDPILRGSVQSISECLSLDMVTQRNRRKLNKRSEVEGSYRTVALYVPDSS